jgi:hypothetical protein
MNWLLQVQCGFAAGVADYDPELRVQQVRYSSKNHNHLLLKFLLALCFSRTGLLKLSGELLQFRFRLLQFRVNESPSLPFFYQ